MCIFRGVVCIFMGALLNFRLAVYLKVCVYSG